LKINKEKLAAMSKEEKLALHDAIQEKKRRDRIRKPQFVPFDSQLKIIKSQALEKYLFCGNGYSKTALLVNWIHWAATGYNTVTTETLPVPSVIYLVVDDPTKIEQKILPEYRKWHDLPEDNCHKDGKPNISRISFDNGSVIHILTHEVNLLKLEGIEMTHLAFDEPPPRHVFIGLYRGGRIPGRPLQVFLAGTPLYQPWIRTDIYEKWVDGELPHVECFSGESRDNPHLPKDYEKRFGALLSEEEKATRFKGAFFDMSGQALAHLWTPKVHMIPKKDFQWADENPCAVIIDPHTSKPQVAVLLGVDRENRFYVLDEYSEKVRAREFARALIKRGWFANFLVVDIIYDSAGNAEMTSGEGYKTFGQVFNEELEKAGVGRARATSYDDKSDEDFVERIQEVLAIPTEPDSAGQKIPKLRASDHCKMFERDVKQVQWTRDQRLGLNKPKLDIRNRDVLACVKYGLASNLHFRKPKDKAYVMNKPLYGFKTRSQKQIKYKIT
jgi:hypothetical protein